MANPFYARYLPRKQAVAENKTSDEFESLRPVKRQKTRSDIENTERATFKDNLQEHQDLSSIETFELVPIPQPDQISKKESATFSALPEWLTHPRYISSMETISFDALPLNPKILISLKNKGYQKAFAIQKAVLPLLLPGADHHPGDICIAATTGSGKTLAYVLPIIQDLRQMPFTRLRGLIIVPTRELVTQARDTFEMCGSGLKIATAFGSKSLKEEQDLLVAIDQRYDSDAYRLKQRATFDEDEELLNWDFDHAVGGPKESECLIDHVVEYISKADILICTPGRLVDHIQSTKGFTLNDIQWLVIDEADRLLDESFQQWIDIVIPAIEYEAPLGRLEKQLQQTFHLLHQRRIRKIVLSATLTKDISKLSSFKLKRPLLIVLETANQNKSLKSQEEENLESEKKFELPPTLTEIAIPIRNAEDKPLHLIELLGNDHKTPIIPSRQIGKIADVRDPKRKEESSSSNSIHDEPTSNNSPQYSGVSRNSSASISSASSGSLESESVPTPLLAHGTLIFTNNNENALRLARLLTLLRPTWSSQVGTLTKSSASSSGRKSLSAFRKRKISVLIASDRASRGLDIPDLAHVINYDMPVGITSYIHRVGRTARAGKEGLATTLVAHHEARWFWNEIARSRDIVRGPEMKVRRAELDFEIGEGDKKAYEKALEILGQEVNNKHD